MAERLDASLEVALTELGGAVAWPSPAPGFATRVRLRVEAMPAPARESTWERWRTWLGTPVGRRPVRRSLLVAIALLLVAATVAAAIGFGLPGVRILFGPAPSPVPSRSLEPSATLGSSLGLGMVTTLEEAGAITGFEPRVPADAGLGAPEASFVSVGRLTMVWPAGPELPQIVGAPGVGLLVTELTGRVDEGYYEKLAQQTETGIEPVTVNGKPGYWFSGREHVLVYRLPGGSYIEETRRMVGDVLIWRDGDLTLRLETSLGLDEALRLAESIP